MMIKNAIMLFIGFLLTGYNFLAIEYSDAVLIGKGSPTFYGNGYKLQKEAHDAFELMKTAALKSGIQIKAVSSYRSFEHQKGIWTRKYKRFTTQGLSPEKAIEKIIEYSTIPGTSRHHWGTDIDIIDGSVPQPTNVLETHHFENNGVFVKLKNWMDTHASNYGFCMVYTNHTERKGFKYEPWHYSYKPISIPMLEAYKKIDLKKLLQSEKLLGSDYFSNKFIEKYRNENILDINPDLK